MKDENAKAPKCYSNFCSKWYVYGASACRKGWSWKPTGHSRTVEPKIKQVWHAGLDAQVAISKAARVRAENRK